MGTTAGGVLAGCSGLSGSSEETTVTTAGPPIEFAGSTTPPYRPWLATPNVIDLETYTFFSAQPAIVNDGLFDLSEVPYARELTALRRLNGLGIDATDHAHVIPTGYVVTGDYDMEEFRQVLTDAARLEAVEEYRGVTIFTSSTADIAVGEVDGLVIRSGTDRMPPVDAVKSLVDAATGAAPRYTDISDDCLALVERLPDSRLVAGRPSGDLLRLENAVGAGIAWRFQEGPTAEVRTVFLYPDGASTDTGAVRDLVERPESTPAPTETSVTPPEVPPVSQTRDFFEGISNVEIETDGRAVTATGQASSERIGEPFLPPWLPVDD